MEFKIDSNVLDILTDRYSSNDTIRIYNHMVEYIILVYVRYGKDLVTFEANIDNEIDTVFTSETVKQSAKELALQFVYFIEEGFDYTRFKEL